MRLLMLSCGLGLAAAARPAAAASCDTLGLTNPVYLQVGDTQEPLLKTLGAALASAATDPVTFLYVTSGSCTNIDAIRTNTPLASGATVKYIPAGFDPATAAPTCTLEADHPLDIANSALFNSACTTDPPPAEVTETLGPVQAYVFAVPEASDEVAITAEEAYFTFGFGMGGMVTPWDDETQMFIRPVTKSTLLALAAAIAVPGAKWKGVALPGSNDVVNALRTSTAPGKAIGILGAEIYDRNRDTLDALAFQAFGQWYAYYADSTSTATDKRNVRDGHYFPWSPTVWMTRTGSPNHARAVAVVDLITSQAERTDFEVLDTISSVGLVPECAMEVSRSFEGGPLSLYQSPEPCGCYYDAQHGVTPSCAVCDDSTPCATGTCRHGYCEER